MVAGTEMTAIFPASRRDLSAERRSPGRIASTNARVDEPGVDLVRRHPLAQEQHLPAPVAGLADHLDLGVGRGQVEAAVTHLVRHPYTLLNNLASQALGHTIRRFFFFFFFVHVLVRYICYHRGSIANHSLRSQATRRNAAHSPSHH